MSMVKLRNSYIFISALITAIIVLLGATLSVLNISHILLTAAAAVITLFIFIISGIYYYKTFEKLSRTIDKSSDGKMDLTSRLPVFKKDFTEPLIKKINIFIAGMHDAVFRVKKIGEESYSISRKLQENSNQVNRSIDGIASSMGIIREQSRSLKDNTEIVSSDITDIRESIEIITRKIIEQTSATTESSAAIEQMVASIKNIETISEQRTKLSESLSETTDHGKNNMSGTVTAIQEIASSTSSIMELLNVINDIADQTGILAINAAIEAAHAGDAGKGFSVVASEISKLSETTAVNANSIAESLEEIISKIKFAEKSTDITRESFNELSKGVDLLIDSFKEMSGGIRELSAGTSEITTAISQLQTSSQDVNTSIHDIKYKADSISNAMKNVTGNTHNTEDAIMEISSEVEKIVKASRDVSELSLENSKYIKIMDREIGHLQTIDKSTLKSRDGQPLVEWNTEKIVIPPPPEKEPEEYKKDDERHWYNHEWGIWKIKKEIQPESAADGTKGKHIIALSPLEHTYFQAWSRGMNLIASAFDISVETFTADWTPETQGKQVKEAIRQKPDLIIISPCNPQSATEWFRSVYNAGIPSVCCNIMPDFSAFPYFLAYTGPDEWGNGRLLAKKFAELMNYKGNYCVIMHLPGSSNYDARSYSVITELKKIAPEMKVLDMQSTKLSYEKTKDTVTAWINKFGQDLNGIVCADDSETAKGMIEAITGKNRSDIVLVSNGNSKIGMDYVKEGKLHAVTLQSAETDGALPVEVAVDYFNGLEIQPIRYLPKKIITKENVDNFYPPQW